MGNRTGRAILLTIVSVGLPLVVSQTAFAADAAGVSQVNGFIRNIIQVLAGIAGLVATGFFVIGGFGYITSSGNPEALDRSKRTIISSGIGLTVVIGAFVLANIVTEIATKAFGN